MDVDAGRVVVALGEWSVDTILPPGAERVVCPKGDWHGAIDRGVLRSVGWLAGYTLLQQYRARWEDVSFALADFDRIGELLNEAQIACHDEVIELLGPPALRVLERRFGTMNDAFHNIGWYVGEMYFFAGDRRGLPLLHEMDRVLAELEGPCDEVRLDVLAQLGWLAGKHGRLRVSFRAYLERYERLAEWYGVDDHEAIEARVAARDAAELAGFRVHARRLAAAEPDPKPGPEPVVPGDAPLSSWAAR